MTDREIEIALGKQVRDGKPLSCPVCSQDFTDTDQPMCSYGDYEYDLFCPHCDLGVTLKVFHNPNW